ncbi:MAG: hypothetical protein V2A61_01665, partial [Calditrichota bacterium]
GNLNLLGESRPGTAFTTLIYSSREIFEPVQISAEVQTRQGMIEGTLEFILPLPGGRLALTTNPNNWIFENENDTARIDLTARLTDDYRSPVSRAPLRFTASAGNLAWFNLQDSLWTPFPADSAVITTGRNDLPRQSPSGLITVRLEVPFNELFNPRQPQERLVQVRVRLDVEPNLEAEPALISLVWRGN